MTRNFLVLAAAYVVLALLFLYSIASCATTATPVPQVPMLGMCELPPDVHDGFNRQVCQLQGTTNAVCVYTGEYEDKQCVVIIGTENCIDWQVVASRCDEPAVKQGSI